MSDRTELGRRGEQAAAEYLCANGMVVLARNWRCRSGELDLVVRDGDTVVFVEVKTRRGRGFGAPLEAITWQKATRLRRLAGEWLAQSGRPWRHVRIDAVGVLWGPDDTLVIEHVRAVCS